MDKMVNRKNAFVEHISIDVTEVKDCAVPKDKFRINKYNFGTPFEDLVHNSEPYLHFQILRPKDEDQRKKALSYFKEHGKLYTSFVNSLDILLYIGCTENVYIKSTMAEVQPEDFNSIMAQAAHWYRFYGKETNNK